MIRQTLLEKRGKKDRSLGMSSSKERLYLDTNIYLDHILKRGRKSSELLRAIANGKFEGFTSYLTISESAGVLKAEGYSESNTTQLLSKIERWPNIQIVLWHPALDRETPKAILATCAQTRDALHFVVARFVSVDKIVTRDTGFANAVQGIIPCVLPEDLV